MISKSETVTGGERLTMSDGSKWFHPFDGGAPVMEQEPCAHDWRRDGTSTGGCVGLVCTRCGEYDEKDVS